MIMKGLITLTIHRAILYLDNTMSYFKSRNFQFLSKYSHDQIIRMKYDGHSDACEHIMKMSDMISQLKGMNMAIYEGFLVHFIMTFLLS